MTDSDQHDDGFESGEILDDETETDADNMVSADSASGLLQKERERLKIQADINAFLASGGRIDSIDDNVAADPPRKPESSYGSQPI